MHIKSFRIQNFKGLADVTFEFDRELNVLTGVNNSGKTSVLEAIALWNHCIGKLISVAGKADNKTKLRPGDFRYGTTTGDGGSYETRAFEVVRTVQSGDIFFQGTTTATFDATLLAGEQELTLGVDLKESDLGAYKLIPRKLADHTLFNTFFSRKVPEAVATAYASPIAAVPLSESFQTGPTVRQRVRRRESATVLRNRLESLSRDRDETRFERFRKDVAYVLLGDDQETVEFEFKGTRDKDVEFNVFLAAGGLKAREISLMGSGTVQIIELLLAVYEERRDLTLVLLDEPDSHLHRDLQKRLIERLLPEGNLPNQVFVTTHNEGFIRGTKLQNLFHLDAPPRRPGASISRTYKPLIHAPHAAAKQGFQPTAYRAVLTSLGHESSLDILNALEADHVVLVEGDDDARFVQLIVEQGLNLGRTFRAMYWAARGIDELMSTLAAHKRGIFSIRNTKTLWEKASLVCDMDYVSAEEASDIAARVELEMTIPTHVWDAYTIEATVLAEPVKRTKIVTRLLQADGFPSDELAVGLALEQEMSALCVRLTEKLDNSDKVFLRAIEGQRSSRRTSMEKGTGLDVKSLATSTGFVLEARRRLQLGQAHHLAGKDDVKNLVAGVYRALDFVFDETSWFERLILASKGFPTIRPREWDRLTQRFDPHGPASLRLTT